MWVGLIITFSVGWIEFETLAAQLSISSSENAVSLKKMYDSLKPKTNVVMMLDTTWVSAVAWQGHPQNVALLRYT